MSQFNQSRRKAFAASSALAAATPNQYLRVKLSAGLLVLAGAADRELGTLANSVFVANDFVSVDLRTGQGTCQFQANAAIAQGADVFTAASGTVGAYSPGANYVGTALEATSASGDIFEVLRPGGPGPALGFTFTPAAGTGGSNITNVTVQVVDSNGVAVAAVYDLDVNLSDAATGAGLTATTASGTVQQGASGAVLGTLTAKKSLRVQTDATGKFILQITDTAKTGFYVAATRDGVLAVSAQLVTANYG